MRPQHLFESSGDLFDTRKPDWSTKPLRKRFMWHHVHIKTVAEFKATLRAGEFAWPGGYQLYFMTGDGAALSFDSARAQIRNIMWAIVNNVNDGWRVVACDINYEDDSLFCDHSGKRIPSAYGDNGGEQ